MRARDLWGLTPLKDPTSPAARVPVGVPDVVPVGAARRGRRALPWMPWCVRTWCAWCVDMVCVVHDGRGRRPRRPACLWASPVSSPMSFPWARRAGDVAPYHGCHGVGVRAWRVHGAWTWCVLCMLVGADVPGGPRPRVVPDVVPDVVPVGAARRGRRALPWVPWCVCMVRVHGAGMVCMHGAWTWRALCGHGVSWCVDMVCVVHVGRGRRPRRPAFPMSFPMSSPMSSPCARRAEDVAPYHGCHGAGVRAWRAGMA